MLDINNVLLKSVAIPVHARILHASQLFHSTIVQKYDKENTEFDASGITEGNTPVVGIFRHKEPVMWTFDRQRSTSFRLWCCSHVGFMHNRDVIMSAIASQITSVSIVNSTVYSGADQRKHQSSTSLAFVRGIYRWPVTRKIFSFDNVIMERKVVMRLRAAGCLSADTRLAHSQWETSLQSNTVPHWLGANLVSALRHPCVLIAVDNHRKLGDMHMPPQSAR